MIIPSVIEHSLRQQAKQGQTLNVYLYEMSRMRRKINCLKRLMPAGVEVFYAMKANPHPAFLAAAIEEQVTGIEIASLGEANKAIKAGFHAEQMIYTGPGKSIEELQWSVQHGVRTIHIESLVEAYRLNQVCADLGKKQDVLLRINANFDIHDAQTTFSGGSKKFGIDEEQLDVALPQILALEHLNFHGLHVYAASGVLNVDDLLHNCQLVFDLTQRIEQQYAGVQCDIIDFGGGFGVDYLEENNDFDPEAYAIGLSKMIQDYGFEGRHFVLELGRWLAADCGWFCTEIIDIKTSRGKKQLVCAGGINHFRRPAALAINHPMGIVSLGRDKLFAAQESVRQESVYFGGPLCTSADKLANDVFIEAADVGDIAVFGLAGAYGLSMSNTGFLSHALPQEIVVTKEES
ncbi:MAG: alanine racemase [Mariprofundaceae bacterium]|nr:alanine racemase [Mariprofundaceae bacterium]